MTFTASDKKKKNLVNRLDNLPEEVIIHELTADELNCQECGTQLVKIGEKVTYKLKYIPAKLVKEKHIFPTYKCNTCYEDDITNIISAKHYTSFPKTMVDGSIVAHLITEKFLKYLPLYRQEKLFRNIGLDISRANLSNWFLAGAKLLKPLVDIMHNDLLKNDIIHMDETTLQVIKTNQNNCYIWGMESSKHDLPIRLYFYKQTREHNNAKVLVKDYKGYIQSDCYEAYDKIEGCINVACIAHARRKYADIIKACNGKLEHTNSLCLEGIKFFKALYSIEDKLEKQKASINQIYETRNSKSKIILEEYKKWLDINYDKVPQKSQLGKAMFYSINNYDNLCNYLLDGRLSIDNNLAERGMKNFVIGRKNFLFSFTEVGAECSAVAYSIVETAIANQLNVYEYIKYVYDTLP